jgi:hypothetical protein
MRWEGGGRESYSGYSRSEIHFKNIIQLTFTTRNISLVSDVIKKVSNKTGSVSKST